MTTVSALPPSATPTKPGGGRSKAAAGGKDFAAMLAGMSTPSARSKTPTGAKAPADRGTPGGAKAPAERGTPGGAKAPAERGTPGGARAGVAARTVVDLAQVDLAGAAAAQLPSDPHHTTVPAPGSPSTTAMALVAAQAPAVAAEGAAVTLPVTLPVTAAAAAAGAAAADVPVGAAAAEPGAVTAPAISAAPPVEGQPAAAVALTSATGPQTVTSDAAHAEQPDAARAQAVALKRVTAEAASSASTAAASTAAASSTGAATTGAEATAAEATAAEATAAEATGAEATGAEEPAAATSLLPVTEAGEADAPDASVAATQTSTDAHTDTDGSAQPPVTAPVADAGRAAPTTPLESFAATPVSDSRAVSAPAAPAAPAPAAPPPPPATQVLTQLGPALKGPDGTYTMSLQLYPEELGAVQVEVSLRGSEISLALHAADDVAKELLRASLTELREQLEATGLTATDVSVDSGDAEQRDPAAAKHAGTSGSTGDGDGDDALAPPPATDPDAALDVRI